MRRTVICWSRPPLRTRRTVPSYACRRSRLPSTTRTDTRTVSPGRISGTSVFNCSEASVFNTSFITRVFCTESRDSIKRLGRAKPVLRLCARDPTKTVEDRHVRDPEVLRELAHGEARAAHLRDLGRARSAKRPAGAAQVDPGRAQARAHRRG